MKNVRCTNKNIPVSIELNLIKREKLFLRKLKAIMTGKKMIKNKEEYFMYDVNANAIENIMVLIKKSLS